LLPLSIEALSSALSAWGKKDGAVIVVSHDKSFCDSVGFNTVGTVKDGSLKLEQRELNSNDWKQYEMMLSHSVDMPPDAQTNDMIKLTPEQQEELKKKRRLAFNAPKNIAKLEKKIEASEKRMAELDDEMMTVGNDVGKLTDISKEKEKEEEKVAEMMEEWEELEILLAEVGQS
jgi:DNA repair exonuclease SbcCD ATPase subunit